MPIKCIVQSAVNERRLGRGALLYTFDLCLIFCFVMMLEQGEKEEGKQLNSLGANSARKSPREREREVDWSVGRSVGRSMCGKKFNLRSSHAWLLSLCARWAIKTRSRLSLTPLSFSLSLSLS